MRIEKGQVRAPEIGRTWLNSPPLSLRQLRGQAVLVDFELICPKPGLPAFAFTFTSGLDPSLSSAAIVHAS